MMEEDPTFVINRNYETKQLLIGGQGEKHLYVILCKIKNKFGVHAVLTDPVVSYRETIKGTVSVQGKHKKQSGGAGQYGDVQIKFEPCEEEFKFVDEVKGGVVPRTYMPAVEKGLLEAKEKGILAGYPVINFKATIFDGSYHPVDSNEISFRLAGRNAFSEAFKNAGPKILEPIYDVEVLTPADVMGDVMSDLQGRRAIIMGMSSEKGFEKITAKVPLKEMSSYSTALSSITGGRSSFSMKFASYELVPSDVQEKLLKAYEAEQTDE